MPRLEDLMTKGLDSRVDSLARAPFSAEDVARAARSVRRRRTALAAGATAFVLAVAGVPAGLALAHRADHAEPLPMVTDTPTTSPTPSGPASAAGVAYVVGRVVHLPNGTTVTVQTPLLPDRFARLADGRFVFVTHDAEGSHWEIAVTGSTGELLATYPMTYSLVVNTDHTAAAWVDPDGHPEVLQTGRDEPCDSPG